MADGSQHPYAARPQAATHDWLTPPAIIEALGAFDLDPCAAREPRPWPTAREHVAPPANGLLVAWRGRVWLNPPYGKHTEQWLARLAEHGDGIALVFARTETRMFQRWVWPRAAAVLFLGSRPKFHHRDGTQARRGCGGPMCLIAYGVQNAAALRQSGIAGTIVVPMYTEVP